ncbi:hypothetical protein [Phascolarctobacterium faecium]|uniref:hypothetical protein n=1 Tax=Phascolarctobacterium faecium TaxID=33025 RepID=UPI003AF03B02
MEHYSNVVKAMIARSNARAADIADKIQARAYYQFQYVPPAGPLPGWSMEQQTEDAINEIGNIAYSSDEIAREAREIAQQAYNAAQAAIEMATNALTAAQNAQQTADTALNTANTAVTKADNAQASADAAQKAADAAQKSANDAQTSADNAQSTADTAIENASQALLAANEAKASADHSNQRLDVLEPIVDTLRWYENVTDNIDFNTRVELERAFLQGTANTNGPIPGPGWLDVDDDYNETYIRQKFIAQADGACYVRFGTIVPDSSPIEVSSWTGWVKYALASELTSAVETINTSITSINGEITTIKSDITSIEGDITELQGSLGNAEGDITAVTNALDAHKADYDNPHKVTAAQLGLATVYKYKGSVETYAALPTSGQQVGDVYNVKQADPDHNIEAGDNVAWDGEKWDILAGDTDLSGYAQLNSANTYTALNLFRANIGVSNGTAAGSQGQVIFGVKPSTATVQANIIASTTGALNYIATESTGHYFKIGNNTASTSITTNESETAILSHNAFEFARITNVGVAKWLGNANTATKLETARTINGVPFDGTKDIDIIVVKSVNGVTPTGGDVDINRKFYNSLAQLGLNYDTVTFDQIANTLPVNSTLTFYVDVVTSEPSYAPNLQIPASGLVIVVKGASNTIPTLFYLTPIVKGYTSYTGQYTTYNDYGFSGWQPMVLSVNAIKPNINGNVNIDIPKPVIASEAEAKAGTNNTKFMTPLRVAQAIDSLSDLTNLSNSINNLNNSVVKTLDNVAPVNNNINMWNWFHRYPYTDFTNGMTTIEWVNKGLFSCFFSSAQTFPQKPADWGQLINIPASEPYMGRSEAFQLFIAQPEGHIYYRGTNADKQLDEVPFKRITVANNGVIRADNTENCLYFCGTAENTYYSTPNTGNTISYQAAANVYLINTSVNDAASLTMNFSNMNFHATVGSVPYMCKTLTFWFVTGATAPTVTWQFPSGAAVYYPKGVAPSLTANASNIINVVAIVDDTDSFSIQVCDVVALPYSG